MPTMESTQLSTTRVRFRFLREPWVAVLATLMIALSFLNPITKWYAGHWNEVIVVNDSDSTISQETVSLPPESASFSNIAPGQIVTQFIPAVVPAAGWRPDQTGILSNGTRIIGNGVNSGEGLVSARYVYIVRKDGTVSAGNWLGR